MNISENLGQPDFPALYFFSILNFKCGGGQPYPMIRRWTCALLVLFFIIQTILPVHGIGEADTSYIPVTAGTDGIFSPVGWLSEPVMAITGYLQEGQSVIGILAPFLAIVVLGIVLVARREQKKGRRQPLVFWLATIAGLTCLGGASITFVQMFRAFSVPGAHPINILPPVLAVAGIILGTLAMRTARSPSPGSVNNRIFLIAMGFLGLVFWSGLFIGPILLFGAAAVPIRIGIPSWPAVPGK
jgi:hypothetical protein